MIEPENTVNLVDDLAEEFARRWRSGERPSIEEYTARFPDWAEALRAVLPAVVMMEQLKPRCVDKEGTSVPPADAAGPPERVSEYRIIREIGRGGMGVVYEADHEALGRRVAIKMLRAHLPAGEKLRARFLREAQAAARLHHTHIVPVFGVGEWDGQCFYVMQLISGQGLDQLLQESAVRHAAAETNAVAGAAGQAGPALFDLAPRAFSHSVADIGVQVADALAYAHGQGVLHRDIKPSNLLLDERGAVWVTDFGVAKIAEGADLTQSGDLVGTLKYMPPERFAGQSDGRGDVYSLGVTLYELLTRQSAFPDTTPHHLIQLITQGTPVAPRKLNPAIPTDLETIVLKAAARDPAQRYQTPGALADDLRRFLYDRPILARRIGPLGHLGRWRRRNPVLAVVTALALLLMVAVTAVSVVAYVQTAAANREAADANHEMEKALAAEKAQREFAETTSTLALEALNRTYDRFAPSRLVVMPSAASEVGVDLPPPTALLPQAIPLLEDLLRTYEQIAQAGERFPKLQAQVAEANHRIGDLRRRLGRFKDAAIAYRTAIQLYNQLLRETPEGAVRVKLARAYNELGRTLRSLHQFDEMVKLHQSAIQTLTDAPKELADRPEFRFELACSYYALGQRDMFLSGPGPGRPPPKKKPPPDKHGPGPDGPPFAGGPPGPPPERGGEHPGRRAVHLLKKLVAEFPSVPEYKHLLACCYRDLPPDRPGPGPRPAKSNHELAVELLQQLIAAAPGVPDYQLDLCEALGGFGPPDPPGKEAEETQRQKRMEQAVALSAELMVRYPNVPEYAAAHARYLDHLGMHLFRLGDFAESVKMHRQAVKHQSKLASQYPDVVAFGLWLGLMERSLGKALGACGELKEARTLLESATKRVHALWKKDQRLEGLRPFLAMAYRELAEVLERSGEPDLAAAAQRKAAEFGRFVGQGPGGGDLAQPKHRPKQ